ncbi:AI-2E family transporter, partial [Kaarinaea lacus]
MTSSSTKWLVAGIVATGVLIYLLAPVLTPFLLGALFAYLGDPLVDRLEARKLSRTVAVIVVFVVILLVVLSLPLILLPLIEQQIRALVTNIPKYIDWVQKTVVPFLSAKLNVDPGLINTDAVKQSIMAHWRDVGGIASRVMGTITKSGVAIIALLANLVLVPVVTFYLLRDWDLLVEKIHHLIPRKQEPVISKLAKESDAVLGQFLRGQLTVMVALGTVYTVGLWIVGLDLALLVGLIAGLVSFVPYLGFIVGILLAGIAAIMQFGDPMYLVYVAIVFGIGQS